MKDLVYLNDDGWYWPNTDAAGPGGAWYDLAGAFAETPEKIAALVPKRKVMVQAGGNCGLYVKRFAYLFDHVYTFEPDPVNFYCLNLNVTEPNVYKFQAALGINKQLVSIGSIIPFNAGAGFVKPEGNIPTLRVDDLGLTECDLIQLDIEGFELHALYGANETLQKFHPHLVLEFGWEFRYGIQRSDIDNYLFSLGYECKGSIPGTQSDILYTPK